MYKTKKCVKLYSAFSSKYYFSQYLIKNVGQRNLFSVPVILLIKTIILYTHIIFKAKNFSPVKFSVIKISFTYIEKV